MLGHAFSLCCLLFTGSASSSPLLGSGCPSSALPRDPRSGPAGTHVRAFFLNAHPGPLTPPYPYGPSALQAVSKDRLRERMHPSGHPVQKGLEVGSPGRGQLAMGWGPEGKTDRTRGPDWPPAGQTRFPLSSQGLFWGFSEKPDLPCPQNSKAGSQGSLMAWLFGDELPE